MIRITGWITDQHAYAGAAEYVAALEEGAMILLKMSETCISVWHKRQRLGNVTPEKAGEIAAIMNERQLPMMTCRYLGNAKGFEVKFVEHKQ